LATSFSLAPCVVRQRPTRRRDPPTHLATRQPVGEAHRCSTTPEPGGNTVAPATSIKVLWQDELRPLPRSRCGSGTSSPRPQASL
jgi:hypothetical protein